MKKRARLAQILIAAGCLIVLMGAGLHLTAGYPKLSAALTPSNLDTGLKNALRAVFLMIGYSWIMTAVVILIAGFTETRIRKAIVLFCGCTLLLQIPLWVGLMGWFIGNEMFAIAGVLIVCGGLLL
jgi:hypothetical protein